MGRTYRRRRVFAASAVLILIFISTIDFEATRPVDDAETPAVLSATGRSPLELLDGLAIKGRAPSSNYSRDEFGGDWREQGGCDTRNLILFRDLKNVVVDETNCYVLSGVLNDPYTGKAIQFARGADSGDVQVDHVVALSDAWQKGAQSLSYEVRVELANDPLNLLAVDGPANQQKSGSDAASWLPSNKAFRCQYVARQVEVKARYDLWVSQAEYSTIKTILSLC